MATKRLVKDWSWGTLIVKLSLTVIILWLGYHFFGDQVKDFVRNNEPLTTNMGAAVSAFLAWMAGFAFHRRVKSDKPEGDFFAKKDLMSVPENKGRYSDRMAYVLAEMSDLAYYEVEKSDDNFAKVIQRAIDTDYRDTVKLKGLLDYYKETTRSLSTNDKLLIESEGHLKDTLKNSGFEYRPPYLNSESVQGFICVYKGLEATPKEPYVVVAFRGSEMKVEDWLTNADATPSLNVDAGKVHGGFYDGFQKVKEEIESSLQKIREELGDDIPVYFTGHSLGGGLATISARELMPDGNGACYTFGAPRVGDYKYFEFMKTPVYRIVNSSDIVPRVPPGVGSLAVTWLLSVLRWWFATIPWVTRALKEAEGWVNKLKDYRHFGDARYLTDVASGKCDKVMLLRNPNNFDVFQWFWRHVLISYGMPIKSHSMTIYRKKLAQIGLQRMQKH